jgi:tetrapyrrole methylase family protein/MazG family protein
MGALAPIILLMEFDELVGIMHKLRRECPWDRKQTHETLKPYLIEEAYELIEAIDAGDPGAMREELGDLLLQVLFHAELARERGEFDISGVIEGISGKMVSRHPHVFGNEALETAEEVAGQWEERKKEEGKLRGSILEGVPRNMPSLLRAHRLQSRAAQAGFDWERVEDVLKKLDEELGEFREALRGKRREEVEDELGDIFFVLVNVSRFVSVNPEEALRKTIGKFISRFRHVEMRAAQAGVELSDMTLEEMDRLWEEAKAEGG